MNTATTDSKPWYKQFWPWFVLGIPAASVVMGISLVYVVTQNKVSMVKDDWYKEGLAINERLDKQLRAKELGLTANIVFNRNQGKLLVAIPQLAAPQPSSLNLELIHPTTEDRDQAIKLILTPQNNYWAKLKADQQGFFYLQLTAPNQAWQLDGAINFNNPQVEVNLSSL